MPGGNQGDVHPFLLVVGYQADLEKLQNPAGATVLSTDILNPLTARPAWKGSGIQWESISFHTELHAAKNTRAPYVRPELRGEDLM